MASPSAPGKDTSKVLSYKIEGTGLGLAITKQLVELMGGKVIVHTVYGEGSKFTIIYIKRDNYKKI